MHRTEAGFGRYFVCKQPIRDRAKRVCAEDHMYGIRIIMMRGITWGLAKPSSPVCMHVDAFRPCLT
jgi:hypothetical protein